MNAGPPVEGAGEAQPEEAATPSPPPPPEAPVSTAPPASGSVMPLAPRAGRSPLVSIIGIAVILVVLAGVYGAVGYEYAQGRLSSARDAYNRVVDHENKYTDAMTAFAGKISNSNINTATQTELEQKKTTVTQMVSTSTAAQPQIEIDDRSLASADSDLHQNSWLTAIDKSEIDKASTRIGHMRKALADARIVTADYIQLGTFYQSFYDVLIDAAAVGDALNGSNAIAIGAALAKIRTDLTKAISLDKGQGVVADYDSYLKDLQTVVNDVTALIDALGTGDSAATDAANATLQKDAAKLDTYDFAKIDKATQAFFDPLLKDYNSEIEKANKS